MDQIRDLLRLWGDTGRPSAGVKALARGHLAELEAKIVALQEMRATLGNLVEACNGDHRPDCPIIDGLAIDGSADHVASDTEH